VEETQWDLIRTDEKTIMIDSASIVTLFSFYITWLADPPMLAFSISEKK
jgi:hypothetical protein